MVRHRIEYAAAKTAFRIFGALPLDMALPRLRRKGIEEHPIRNRRIARLGKALVSADSATLAADFSSVCSEVDNDRLDPRVDLVL